MIIQRDNQTIERSILNELIYDEKLQHLSVRDVRHIIDRMSWVMRSRESEISTAFEALAPPPFTAEQPRKLLYHDEAGKPVYECEPHCSQFPNCHCAPVPF